MRLCEVVSLVCTSVARKVTNDQWLTIKKAMDQKLPLKIKRGYLSLLYVFLVKIGLKETKPKRRMWVKMQSDSK